MSALRNLVALSFLGLFFFYLSAGDLAENDKWVLISVLGGLAVFWVMLGGQKKPRRRASAPVSQSQARQVELLIENVEHEEEDEEDLPAPMTTESVSQQTLRERKMAKIAAIEARETTATVEEEIVVEVEDVHVAEEYVVEVSAETFEEADIQVTVTERKQRHDKIRERIEVRRRNQLADIRSAANQKWNEADKREDIVALLSQPNHGLTIHLEPEQLKPGHTYGSTFIRLDEHNILRVRIPIDEGFESVADSVEESVEEQPQIVGPDGKILPPLIGPDGKPLPLSLPSLPSPSGALAALKMEMDED